MDEQILKDFLATLESNSYDYDSTLSKFPELANYDVQLLKDYAATAKAYNYNYEVVNPKFPEFTFKGLKKNENSKVTSQEEGTDSPTEQVVEEPISVESSLEEEKNDENSYQDWFLGSSKGTVSSIEKEEEEEEPAPVSSLPEVYNLPEGGINTEEIQKTIDEGNLGFTPSEIDAQEKNKLRAERGLLQIDINDQKDLTLNPISEEEIKAEQDRINAISIKNKFPESANDPVVLRNSDDPFDRGMGRIDDFFWQVEQKSAADLNKAFNQYGFKFEEADILQDSIKVTSANGNEIKLSLSRQKERGTASLKKFLNENRVESTIVHDRIKGVLGEDVKKETRVLKEDELDEESNIYTLQFEAYQEKIKDYKKRVQILKDFTPQTQQELNIYNTEIKNVNTLGESINKGREELISSEDNLNKLTSDYLYYEAEKWDVASLTIQTVLTGLTKTIAGGATLLSEAAEVITYINNPALSQKIGDRDGFKKVEDRIIAGRDQIIDDLQVLGSTNVAIENIKEDNFVAGSLLSVLESVPAMATGLPGLFAMSYGAADDAFREYEGYEDIGKIEAFTMKVGLSAAAAYLEKAGLDNAMGRTGLLNRFLLQTLKEVPKDATELVIKRTLERRAIDFVKGLGSAAVGEGITEGAQEAVDITAKAVYNAMKGIDVFKTPKTFVEGVMQVGESTAAGVIGGIALGGAGALATAVSTEQVSQLPDGIVEMFEMMSASSKFDPLFSQSLKVQLAKGTITKEQAQNQLDNYHEAKAIIKTIPKDYTTPQKKMAMSLLVTKKNLEKDIAGQDPFMATDLKQQLDKVNASLSTIKQDITNMNEGTEVSNTDKKYFFNFKSKKEIPASLKKVKPVGKAVSKKTKLSKAENIQLAFTGSQLIESGFAVEQKAKTTTEVQPATETTTEVQPATETTTEAQEEVVVETTPAIEAEETVGQVVNRPVMLTEYGGKVFDEPIKGNLLIEDQRVSFEAEDGKIYDIGNKNDLENKRIDEVGIKYEAPNVKVSKDGSLEVGGNKYTIQTNLPTVGVEYNDDGDVTAVSVKDDSGKPVMFKGTIAEEMGYQILLNEAESDAQKNKINEILEKDEEFKNELRQAEESSKKEADTNTKEAVRKTVDNQETEVESEPAPQTTKVEAKKAETKTPTKGVSKLRSKFKPKQETEEKTKAAPRKDIDDQVENAKKALSKVAPEVEIIVSESETEYKEATKEGRNQNSGGRYVDGKIYINPNRANKRTVAHEVFHALLLSKGRTDQQAQAITERMMEAVKKNADQELLDRLDKFSSNYKKALESEESIAELMGILANGYNKLNPEAKSLIKRWLDRLAKIFGIKPLTSDTDIINFLNTVSGKIASGKKIRSRDIKVLGDVDSEVKNLAGKTPDEIVNSVRKQKGLINLSEQEVLKYARAGIENQYEAQAIKQIGLQGVTFTKEGIQGKVKEELDSLIKESDNYIMSEDSKAVDGAIQFEINTLINDGASEAQIENAKQAFQPGSMRDNFINKYKETQKETLDQWKSYLSESDYNDSFKYLILDAVLTNNYDFKTNKYTKRNNKTIRNYTPFDAGTLASLYASDSKSLLKDYVEIQAQNSKNVVESSSFVSTKEGEWLKFEGGPSVSNEVRVENANKLSQIVQNTYWCTKTNAKGQLDDGDFYVYATKNSEGEYESRVAVRMEGDKVGEVRGNASSKQDLEPDMMPVADKFLKENIPNGSGKKWLDSIEYNTRVKELTEKIEGKKVTEQSLEEYIAIIKDSGKFKVDYGENGLVTKLKKVFDDSEFDFPVARDLRELRPDTLLFIGEFRPIKGVSSNIFPKYVFGNAYFGGSQVTDLGQLQSIDGDVFFGSSEITDLGQLQSIGGHANFSYSQVTDLGKLQSIGGDAIFNGSKITDLGQLQSIGRTADFNGSQVADLGQLQSIDGDVFFGGSEITDLGQLQSIGGTAYFNGSQVAGLGQLQSIDGDAIFTTSKVTDLGQLQFIGNDALFGGSEVTDLGQLQFIGRDALFGDSKVTDLGQLQSIGGNALFGAKIVLRLKWKNRKNKSATQTRQQKSDRSPIAEVLEYAKQENISEQETIEFLKEEGYSDAEINEAIEIDKEIERQSKKSTKRPLSAKKILKKEPAPKKGFTTTQLIKLQESVSKLAERVTKKNIKEKRKAIKKIIASFEKGKSISTAKSQAITNRVNNVNLSNRKAVESLIEYIEKTYSDSKSKEDTTNLNDKRLKAKKYIRSKIGEAKGSFEYFLSLFSYDPKLITNKNLLDEYQYLVEQYGDSSKFLNIEDIRNDAETAKKIIESIEEEFDQFNSLFDLFNENTILTDGELDIEETIKALEDSEQIDSKQAAILTKYKDKLDATSKELKEFDRETAIKEALDYNGEVSNNVTESAMSRGFASKFLKLAATKSNLQSLSNNQLRNLKKVLENINNGIFSHSATEILNEMDVKQNTDALQKLVNKAKALKIESLLGEIRSSLTSGRNTSEYSQVSSNALKDIDNILGLKGTEFYDRTFKRAAVMTSNYEEAVREINDELVKLNTAIDKGSKSFNDAVKSKYKIQAYKLQLEYDSNKKLQNSTVFPAEQWIDETIKALEDKKQSNDVELLKQVKKEISGKDAKTIYEGFSKIESKAVKKLKKINDGLTEKALFTGAVIRGNRPTIVNDYLFHDVMSTDNKAKEAKDVANNELNKITNISTQAGTLKERTPGLKALNMDPLNSTLRGAKQTLLDFHITNENRVIKKTLNSLEKSTTPGAPRNFMIASNKAYDTALRVQFANAYAPRNFIDKLTNAGYQAQLASVPRAFAELSSNLLYVGLSDPVSFGKGVKIVSEIGVSEALEYMRLSGSSEVGKFTGAKGTGKTMESINLNEDISRAKAASDVMNAIKTAYAKAGYKDANLKNLGKVAGLASDFLISKPDKLVSLPLWTGQFVSALKASKVDLARFKSEPEYRSEMSNEIEAARNKADKSLTMAAGSKNAFSGVLKNKVDKEMDSSRLQAYKYVNSYLTNFLIYEFSNARKGVLGLVHKGDLTQAQGAAMLAATTARMTSYTLLYKMFQGIFYGALNLITGGEEEEKEEEDTVESLARGVTGSAINLLVGRNFGQIGRIFLNMGSEYVNEEYLGFLRGGEEYNAFEHGLGVSFFNPTERDMRGDSFYKKSVLQAAGPLNPFVKVLEDMRVNYAKYNYATSQQEKDKASDYFVKQMLFDVVGSVTGKIPFYKDLKKTLFQIPKNNEFLQKKNQFTYKEMKEQDEDNFNNTEEKLKEDKKYKELVNTSKDLKGVIDSGVLSSEATKEASFKLKTINKDKEDYKRDYFENSLGLKGKKRDKTNSKNDGLTLDQGITKQKEAAKYDNDITYIKENLSKDDFEDIEYDFKSSDRISDIDYDLGDLKNQLKYTPKDSEEKEYNSIKNKIEKKSKKRKELKRIFYNNKYNAIKKKSGID